jgi:BlaI family transcriptional regulator, penicillinase repressor
MHNESIPVPTDAELEILQVLWNAPNESVRHVNETINQRRAEAQQVGYTTTLKQMQVMLDKGLLLREVEGRNHLYTAAQSRDITQTKVVQEVADLAFNGNAMSLALHALGSGKTTIAELEEIKAMIRNIEAQRTKD